MKVTSSQVDASAQRRAHRRSNPAWSLLHTVAAVHRFVKVLAGHTADGYGGLAELHATAAVLHELQDAVDAMARHLLEREECSYREVSAALGITRQAAAKRYPSVASRRPGGQPARLR